MKHLRVTFLLGLAMGVGACGGSVDLSPAAAPGRAPRLVFANGGFTVQSAPVNVGPRVVWAHGGISVDGVPAMSVVAEPIEPMMGGELVVVETVSPPPGPPDFDDIAARQALEGVDITSCRAPGPHDRETTRVTWSPQGRVEVVEMDTPANGAPDAGCVSMKFAALSVPPFPGGPRAMTFYAR